MTGESASRKPLPALELLVRVLRDRGRLELGRGEIFVGPSGPADPRPRVVEWHVVDGLMPDEMILVFGRPLDWTGPRCAEDPGLRLVENCLGGPLILTRREPVARSPEPTLPQPLSPGASVGWCFGAVLLRGDDRPWYGQSLITISRIGPDRA